MRGGSSVRDKRRANFYFDDDYFIGRYNNNREWIDSPRLKKKKKIQNCEYLFRDSDLDLSKPWSKAHGETHGRGWEEGEIYGALMRILPKDRSPAIMIHGFDVQRIADAPCYVIVSQLTTRIP